MKWKKKSYFYESDVGKWESKLILEQDVGGTSTEREENGVHGPDKRWCASKKAATTRSFRRSVPRHFCDGHRRRFPREPRSLVRNSRHAGPATTVLSLHADDGDPMKGCGSRNNARPLSRTMYEPDFYRTLSLFYGAAVQTG